MRVLLAPAMLKLGDSACPFCGANGRATGVPIRRFARMSRAEWLAYGSTFTMLGCMGEGTSASVDVQDAASVDVQEAASVDVQEAAHLFLCANLDDGSLQQCDRRTQYCDGRWGIGSCLPFDAGPLAAVDAGGACPCSLTPLGGYFGLTCVFAYPPSPDSSTGKLDCSEDDAGGISVSYHSCYGSPPARLERLPPRGAAVV
jgi:hypothetical protein